MLPPGSIKLPKLRHDLQYSIHQQGDERWYCIQDPLNGQFYRLGSREYALACRFTNEVTPDEFVELISQEPEFCKSQSRPVAVSEVLQLAMWLARSGLCQTEQTGRASSPYRKWVLNPLSMRIPLIAGHILERPAKWIAPWINSKVLLGIVVVYIAAMVTAISHWKLLTQVSGKLFVADSQLWWAAAWLVLKIFHELGHAVVAVRVGSQIRAAGINIVFFAPIPYVDVSDLWTIPNRLQRIACSAGGILTELAIASIATFIAVTTDSESVRYFCCAVAVTGTITTLVFNANPLMRFDGYYILADLLNIPNLWTTAQTSFNGLIRRIVNPWASHDRSFPNLAFASYGAASLVYRTMMSLTMAATAILVWKSVGVLLVLWAAYAMYINPWIMVWKKQQIAKRMNASSKTQTPRWATGLWSVSIAASLLAAVTILPSPIQPTAPGVVTYHEPIQITAESQGTLEHVAVQLGQKVSEGQVIATLQDHDLEIELQLKRLEAQSVQESMRTQQARGNLADLQAAQARLESLQTQLHQLEARVQRLTVTAPQAGVIVQLSIDHCLGQNVTVGTPICMLATSDQLEAKFSVCQRDLRAFHDAVGQQVAINVIGGKNDDGLIAKVELKGSAFLDEPLLAGVYNGPIPVELEAESKNPNRQLKLISPRFAVHLRLPSDSPLVPGQMVWTTVPGDSASLAGVVGQWLKSQWDSLKHQLEG